MLRFVSELCIKVPNLSLCQDYKPELVYMNFIPIPVKQYQNQLDATDDFYCRSYCLLNMFRAPLCPSSGAREYYTSGCCLSYLILGFQVVVMVWCRGLCVWSAGVASARSSATARRPHHTDNLKTKHQIRQAAATCIILSSSWWWA